MDLTLIIAIIVVAALAMGVAGIYNNLVTLRNRVDNAWQNIDTQLQRRNDLVPNLVETVKGYAAHEKETLDAVTEARAAAGSAATPEEKMAADNVLTGALRQLLMVAEAYPDLKANANFTQLQTSLEDTENKISYARQSYNDCVLNYNNGIQTFPGNIFAGVFQFKPRTGLKPRRRHARFRRSSSSRYLRIDRTPREHHRLWGVRVFGALAMPRRHAYRTVMTRSNDVHAYALESR